MNQVSRNIALWLVVVLMFLLLFNFFSRTQRQAPEEKFSEFLNQVDSGDVKEVTIQGNVITGIRKNTETLGPTRRRIQTSSKRYVLRASI